MHFSEFAHLLLSIHLKARHSKYNYFNDMDMSTSEFKKFKGPHAIFTVANLLIWNLITFYMSYYFVKFTFTKSGISPIGGSKSQSNKYKRSSLKSLSAILPADQFKAYLDFT